MPNVEQPYEIILGQDVIWAIKINADVAEGVFWWQSSNQCRNMAIGLESKSAHFQVGFGLSLFSAEWLLTRQCEKSIETSWTFNKSISLNQEFRYNSEKKHPTPVSGEEDQL